MSIGDDYVERPLSLGKSIDSERLVDSDSNRFEFSVASQVLSATVAETKDNRRLASMVNSARYRGRLAAKEQLPHPKRKLFVFWAMAAVRHLAKR